MLKDQMSTQANRPARTKKLSPELNEFLHMLDALEGQMSPRETTNTQQR
jgi:hypothetical protein